MSNKIDFICIGTEKAGTTWLTKMLRQHPSVFIPQIKEIHYFNERHNLDDTLDNLNHYNKDNWYQNFFYKANGRKTGDISPGYLSSKNAAKDIFEFEPETKIIAILRNPVESVFSRYLYFRRIGFIKNNNFEVAITKYCWLLLEKCLYYQHLKRYFDIFSRKNIKVVLYDDLKRDPVLFLKQIECFLEIEEYIPANVKEIITQATEPKFIFLNIFMDSIRNFIVAKKMKFLIDFARPIKLDILYRKIISTNKKNNFVKPIMDKGLKNQLLNYFSEDVKKLEVLIERDLTSWKEI